MIDAGRVIGVEALPEDLKAKQLVFNAVCKAIAEGAKKVSTEEPYSALVQFGHNNTQVVSVQKNHMVIHPVGTSRSLSAQECSALATGYNQASNRENTLIHNLGSRMTANHRMDLFNVTDIRNKEEALGRAERAVTLAKNGSLKGVQPISAKGIESIAAPTQRAPVMPGTTFGGKAAAAKALQDEAKQDQASRNEEKKSPKFGA